MKSLAIFKWNAICLLLASSISFSMELNYPTYTAMQPLKLNFEVPQVLQVAKNFPISCVVLLN